MIQTHYAVQPGPREGTFYLTLIETFDRFLLDGPGLDEVVADLKSRGWREVQIKPVQ